MWTPAAFIAIIGVVVTIAIAAAGYLIQWGIFKAKIEGLEGRNQSLSDRIDAIDSSTTQRIDAAVLASNARIEAIARALGDRCGLIEAEINKLGDLRTQVGKIETGMGFMLEQMKDMNASIRWMRQPATPDHQLPER